MKLAEVEQRLGEVDVDAGRDLIYELLAAYGIPQSSITRLRTGAYDKSGDGNTVLWKNKVWDEFLADTDDDRLLAALDRAQANTDIGRLKPRFYVAHNDRRLAAVDSRLGQTLDVALDDLARHAAFFMPWAGAEKTRSETITYVDTKVAQEMAKLYDEVIVANPDLPSTDDGRRDLNIFFSRLLFCFFAEDTGVFDDGIFTDAVNRLTATDGTDTAAFLDQLFAILDTPDDQRSAVPSHFEVFGYVNGSLFSDRLAAPTFSRRARNIVVDCGTLDWSSINPDIFGSMIQAVTAGEDRSNLGMHYTSVENILKVLNPLFLDDLEERLAAADTVRKLEALLDHLGEIRVFDPACGSGNFLIVAYKRLRSLEHRILERLAEIDSSKAALFADSRISLESFYGIEIDDFAHDIAKLSLWFAKHQMNLEYNELFGIDRPLIPLAESGAIVSANAARANWEDVCPPTQSTFVCGNPPYLGAKLQKAQHRSDFANYFLDENYSKNLDYISIWFAKSADYLRLSNNKAALVSTNSVCQGQHVGLLWPLLFDRLVEIDFAHTSFEWSNGAPGSAGVNCVVIGLAPRGTGQRRLFGNDEVRKVANINPYLVASPDNTVVTRLRDPLASVPKATLGSMAKDGNNLILSPGERHDLLVGQPDAERFVKPYVGSSELLNSVPRYCLWIEDHELDEAREVAGIRQRLDAVVQFRRNSKDRDASKFVDRPHRFVQTAYRSTPCIAIPGVSSARRSFIPLGWFPAGTVLSYATFAVYDAAPWLFALLHSTLHMAWVRSVGGRMKSDYRYSNTLCYNTFPFPDLDDDQKAGLNEAALRILAARERWPDRSLAQLYDPDKMPANLRAAHEANDELVDSLHWSKPFASDADRMELLLGMYRDLVATQDATNRKSMKG